MTKENAPMDLADLMLTEVEEVAPEGYHPSKAVHDDGGLRTVSYGGGVQSTAMLVLAAQGDIDFKTFLFCNVGDDSEHPVSVWYVRHVAAPYGAAFGIDVQELHRRTKDGEIETLWGRLMKDGSRSLPIPVRMDNGAPGNRSCTMDFKIRVVGKWLKQNGAHGGRPATKSRPAEGPRRATVGIGISTDEAMRVNTRRAMDYEQPVYPLLNMPAGIIRSGKTYSRSMCEQLIRTTPLPAELAEQLRLVDWTATHPDPAYARMIETHFRPQLEASNYTLLPVPPKSSCFFCPFHRPSTWLDQRRDEPELFAKSVHLEETLNARRAMLGKDKVYLTRFATPLVDVVPEGVETLAFLGDDQDAQCDNGVCWT